MLKKARARREKVLAERSAGGAPAERRPVHDRRGREEPQPTLAPITWNDRLEHARLERLKALQKRAERSADGTGPVRTPPDGSQESLDAEDLTALIRAFRDLDGPASANDEPPPLPATGLEPGTEQAEVPAATNGEDHRESGRASTEFSSLRTFSELKAPETETPQPGANGHPAAAAQPVAAVMPGTAAPQAQRQTSGGLVRVVGLSLAAGLAAGVSVALFLPDLIRGWGTVDPAAISEADATAAGQAASPVAAVSPLAPSGEDLAAPVDDSRTAPPEVVEPGTAASATAASGREMPAAVAPAIVEVGETLSATTGPVEMASALTESSAARPGVAAPSTATAPALEQPVRPVALQTRDTIVGEDVSPIPSELLATRPTLRPKPSPRRAAQAATEDVVPSAGTALPLAVRVSTASSAQNLVAHAGAARVSAASVPGAAVGLTGVVSEPALVPAGQALAVSVEGAIPSVPSEPRAPARTFKTAAIAPMADSLKASADAAPAFAALPEVVAMADVPAIRPTARVVSVFNTSMVDTLGWTRGQTAAAAGADRAAATGSATNVTVPVAGDTAVASIRGKIVEGAVPKARAYRAEQDVLVAQRFEDAFATAAVSVAPNGGTTVSAVRAERALRTPAAQVVPARVDASGPPEAVRDHARVTGATVIRSGIRVYAPNSLPDNAVGTVTADLASAGYEIEKSARVGFKVSRSNVRYYHAQDAELAASLAEDADALLRDFTGSGSSVPPGTVELWLAGQGGGGSVAKPKPAKTTKSNRQPNRARQANTDQLRSQVLQKLRSATGQ